MLRDPNPGETKIMRKRQFPGVLWFNKSIYGNNPKKYMLSELMLYKPTIKEIEEDKIEILYNENYEGKRKVDIVKNQVMEHLEAVEEARYYIGFKRK